MKHHPDVEYNEDLLLNDDSDSILTKEDPTLIGMLFSLHGLYIIGSLGLFLVINYSLELFDSKDHKKKIHSH